jgi:hypothetical protein
MLNREFRVAGTPVSALCITHTLAPAGVLWCMGHVASAPCVQTQASTEALSRAGTSASVAAWQTSQVAAIGPRARRAQVMKPKLSAAHAPCQMKRTHNHGQKVTAALCDFQRLQPRSHQQIAPKTCCSSIYLNRPFFWPDSMFRLLASIRTQNNSSTHNRTTLANPPVFDRIFRRLSLSDCAGFERFNG